MNSKVQVFSLNLSITGNTTSIEPGAIYLRRPASQHHRCRFPPRDLLGGQLALGPVVVHAIVGDSSELPAAVVLVVDVVRHVLQVLHVSPRGEEGEEEELSERHRGTDAA